MTSLGVNEYGLLLNSWTGTLATYPVRGGLHRRWPWQTYIKFPATQVTIAWASSGLDFTEATTYISADLPPIRARSGHDRNLNTTENKNEASGQPVVVSCALQYKYLPDKMPSTYLELGSHDKAKERYELMARYAVIAKAQDYSPQDFWEKRDAIAIDMLDTINETLKFYHAQAIMFEILKVNFEQVFEDSVVNTQVEAEMVTVKSYVQQVTQIVKGTDKLSADNQKHIAQINATAKKQAKEMISNATKHVFELKQKVKAELYKKFKSELGLSNKDMKEYVKIKSLIAKSQSGKVTVNLPKPKGRQKTTATKLVAMPKVTTPDTSVAMTSAAAHAEKNHNSTATSHGLASASNAAMRLDDLQREDSHADPLAEVIANFPHRPSMSAGRQGPRSGAEL